MRTSISQSRRIYRRSESVIALALACAFSLLVQGCSSSSSTSPTPTLFPTSTIIIPTPTPTPTFDAPVKPTVIRTILLSKTPEARATVTSPPQLSPTPTALSRVEVQHSGDSFVLAVNSRPTIVRGMNYNVNYTQLAQDLQLKLHRRDFKVLSDAGVNAVIGWGIYDQVTLQVAEEFGIGVIMPYELDPDGAFDNEGYRNQIKADFRDYVIRFRNYPAVWGWNPGGDELLYRMRNEKHRTVDKIQIAADLELELVTLAHALDPNHINVIKEPRDWFIKYLDVAIQKTGTRPDFKDLNRYLIYGVNVYGHFDDIEMTLKNAKQTLNSQMGLAMLVSEFGPFNSPRVDRPANYAGIWDIVSRISNFGGCAYAFGPDQPNPAVPNPYDPLTLLPNEYSLVDMNGKPVDDSLGALAVKWLPLTTGALSPPIAPTSK